MKKSTKVLTASALGVSLLLGGSTYALWSSNTVAPTGSTIQIGQSSLNAIDAGSWTDAVNSTTIASINEFRTVPSDKLTYAQNFQLDNAGGSTKTKVDVHFSEATDAQVAELRARGITLSVELRDADGNTLSSSAVDGNSLDTNYTFNGAAKGTTVQVFFKFDFASTVTADDTKNLSVVVDNATLSANQVS